MKSSFKKYLSIFFVLLLAFSCFTVVSFAADGETATESVSTIQKILTFLFGENAYADGSFDFSSIFHTIVYKDSPIFMKIYDIFYYSFWDALIGILNLFTK
ncbi:MAG: hypothetical protein IJB86_01170 [Clostridia bacterium]|nr:hypothetical protein [Clostridia bacterium]